MKFIKPLVLIISLFGFLPAAFSSTDTNSNIQCIAIYSDLAIGFEKKGQQVAADTIARAGKKRADKSANEIGREQARQKVLSSKYMKQKHPDAAFIKEAKRCLKEDGF